MMQNSATTAKSREERLDELLDREEIRECLYRYCRAIDRGDRDKLSDVYHPGATDNHGIFSGTIEEFQKFGKVYSANPAYHLMNTLHLCGNILIDFAGKDAALVETYFFAYHYRETHGEGFDELLGGRYVDRFERRNGRWGIAHRDVAYEWSQVMRAGERFWDGRDLTHFIFGERTPDDMIYDRVRALRSS